MNASGKNAEQKAAQAAQSKKKAPRRSKLSQITRSALLAVGLTAAQLSEEADFFGEKIFHRNLVDRLHSTSLTRYHD
ncbi:MAG: hypothetical protein ABIZ81_04195 [Opitutaceae bacterium]